VVGDHLHISAFVNSNNVPSSKDEIVLNNPIGKTTENEVVEAMNRCDGEETAVVVPSIDLCFRSLLFAYLSAEVVSVENKRKRKKKKKKKSRVGTPDSVDFLVCVGGGGLLLSGLRGHSKLADRAIHQASIEQLRRK